MGNKEIKKSNRTAFSSPEARYLIGVIAQDLLKTRRKVLAMKNTVGLRLKEMQREYELKKKGL